MKFTSSLNYLLVLVIFASIFSNVNGKGKKKGKKDCRLVTNSPQFATLCRLESGTNTPLPQYDSKTADQVCDQDCRCVMGAQRGGQCGPSPIDNKNYCLCDYESPASIAPETSICPLLPTVTNLCNPGTSSTSKGLNRQCNSDCTCSHGFKANRKRNKCTTKNGVFGNNVNFCVCNNAKNN